MKCGDEMGAGCEDVITGIFHARLDVVEIDASEGLLNVEVAGLTVGPHAAPVVHAIGGVRVLLDFMNEKSCADGVEPAGLDEKGIAGFGRDGMHEIGNRAVSNRLLEFFTGCTVFQSDVEFGTWEGICDEPHFGLWFAAELFGDGGGRVDLDGKGCRAIEDFDQDGETFAVGELVAENLTAMVDPEIVEGFSRVRTIADDGLGALAIDDFPCFAERGGGMGEIAVVNRFKFASAPDALDVEGFEGDGGHVAWGNDSMKKPVSFSIG